MAVAGSLTYDTKIDKNGFDKGLKNLESSVNSTGTKIKNIVAALGIDKIISTAFGILNSSIDGAISRLDTLNNFPKVMSNLGIASNDAQKSINKMSDKLSGLPTTLDSGAQAVQRFTSANKDVNKSTDYFLAFNNALLAGGASAEIQANALEQLSQMYAVGTVDAQAWRSVLTAMPAQLQQVATYMGYTSTAVGGDLYTALQKGKISMEDLMQAMVKLNTDGANGFQTFEQQARNSTSGIETSITVAKTQIVKGVADIINALDQFLKDEGWGGIGEIVSNIGKKSKEVLDFVAKKLPEVLEKAKEIANVIIENKDKLMVLAGIIATVVTAYRAYKTALVAITVINMAQKVYGTISAFIQLIPAIKSAKDVMMLLNAAFGLNPIALIIAGIAALAAAFIYFWRTSESFRNFWIGLWESIKNAVLTAIDFIVQWFNKIVDFVKNNWQNILLFITNPFLGGFKLLYNNCESFRNFIDNLTKKIKETFLNAWNGISTFFTSTIPNAFKKLGESISNKLKQCWNDVVSFFTETIPQWIQNVIDWFANLPYMIGYHIGQILRNIIQFGINLWNWVTVELPQIIQSIIDWFASLPGKIQEWLINVVNNIRDWGINVYNVTIEWISNTINSIVDWFSQLPGRIQEWISNTYNKIVEWVTNVYNTVTDWISRTVNSIVDWFSQLPGRIWNWLIDVINKVKNWGVDLANKAREAAQNMFNNIVDTIKNLPDKMMNIGKNIVEGLWNGIKNAKDWMKQKVGEFANGVLDGMKDSLGIHSPSTKARDLVGKFIPQGVAVGVEANTDSALRAIDNMNDDIMSEMNKAVAFETGSVNAKASVKSNNSMLNVIQAAFNIDGSIDIDGQKAGRILTPYMSKTLRTGGVY